MFNTNFLRNIVLVDNQSASTRMLIIALFHILTSTTVSRCSKFSIAWSAISTIDAHNYVSDIVVPVSVLFPNKIAKCTANQVEQLCADFPEDLQDPDALLAEMEIIGGAIEQSEAKNLREAARFLKEKRFFYPALAKAYQLALTIPISVASNERSFSKLRLVKNYLRSTMKEDRLDSLMILASSPDILDNVDIDKIADSWSNLKARRVKI
ncbi:zinc finger MYM-type 1-like [Paramuricea clavata]|uniref:Zinc finger MYM-type 1-like n=1 Tax=Paramuricea clavata TaxID=317549 RepID=A0A7D9JAH9_PARCT|nr:zinc finger MYM-type 1-like [Paramuricea clavata]